MKKQEEIKQNCPHCNKTIKSKYQKQFEYNYMTHVKYCKFNPNRKK